MTTPHLAAALVSAASGHPAIAAWREFSHARIDHHQIDMLRTGNKSATFRIFGAGPAGTSLIVQRSRIEKAMTERLVYEQILRHAPVTSPRFYGLKPESAEYAWIFLEDVGDQRYGENDPVHRSLAGRWVGLLHSAASHVPAARSLPDGGPQRYRSHLRTIRATIRANLANPALMTEDGDLLCRIVADLDALEGEWDGVERACAGVPKTLVHGDFWPENVYMRQGRDGLGIFPIDWKEDFEC